MVCPCDSFLKKCVCTGVYNDDVTRAPGANKIFFCSKAASTACKHPTLVSPAMAHNTRSTSRNSCNQYREPPVDLPSDSEDSEDDSCRTPEPSEDDEEESKQESLPSPPKSSASKRAPVQSPSSGRQNRQSTPLSSASRDQESFPDDDKPALYRALEEGGGAWSFTRENSKLARLCDKDVDLYGVPYSKKRRSVQNHHNYCKSNPIKYSEFLSGHGINPHPSSHKKIEEARRAESRQSSSRKKTPSSSRHKTPTSSQKRPGFYRLPRSQTSGPSQTPGPLVTPGPQAPASSCASRASLLPARNLFAAKMFVSRDTSDMPDWPQEYQGREFSKFCNCSDVLFFYVIF